MTLIESLQAPESFEASDEKQAAVEDGVVVPGLMSTAALEPPEEPVVPAQIVETAIAASSQPLDATAENCDGMTDEGLLGRLSIRPSALKIGQEIGTGVHGTVRQGVLQHSGRQMKVAVKGLSALGKIDKDAFNAELCEVLRASQQVPGVTKVYGTCLKALAVGADQELWLVTELYSRSVADMLLREADGLGETRVIKYLSQLCIALSQLHSAGIVHQNIKPQNLLLTEQDEIVINDFGVAHILNKVPNAVRRTEGPIHGSLEYMAPETLASRDAYLQDVMFDPDLADSLECEPGLIAPAQDAWSLA
eukprot:502687-Rhodomonas_salina.1